MFIPGVKCQGLDLSELSSMPFPCPWVKHTLMLFGAFSEGDMERNAFIDAIKIVNQLLANLFTPSDPCSIETSVQMQW